MTVYHGNILYAPRLGEIVTLPGGYVAVGEEGRVLGCSESLPRNLEDHPVEELGDSLLIPAFNDLHLHAAQLPSAGLGYDGGGEEWFSRYTYPAEHRYTTDSAHAHAVNRDLVEQLWENGIMRSVLMCAVGEDSTRDLMEQMMDSGLGAYVGKMNSDHDAFGPAQETTGQSLERTLRLVDWARGRSEQVRYILSPEFVPAVSEELMAELGRIAREEGLPVQSHMSEGEGDLALVRKRFPQEGYYGYVWDKYGLFGQTPTVMAHCLFATDGELALMAKRGVFIAHCPNAAQHIPSGRFLSVRKALDMGVRVGLGSDIGGGHTVNMFQTMVTAIQASKMLTVQRPLTAADVFYLATKGGGAFFGKVGSFEEGYAFDALVVDDFSLTRHGDYTLSERLQRLIYCGCPDLIRRRFCAGREVERPRGE